MYLRNLSIAVGILFTAVGCTQVKNPDGSVTTMIGDHALVPEKPAESPETPKDPEVIDNRQLHINSHNMNASESTTAPVPITAPREAGRILPRRIGSEFGANGLDSTVYIPSRYLQETTESKSVKAGAAQFAMTKGCMFLQRYRIAINADFTGTMNLMKYRASGMGAEWINIQFHAESTPLERIFDYGASMFLVDGTQTLENEVFTVMEADLFDCG